MNISSQTHAWCDQCETIRPLLIADMPGDDASGRFTEPSDIQCGACGFVIATLDMPKSKTVGEEALQRQ